MIYLQEGSSEAECQDEYGVTDEQAGILTHFEVKLLVYFDNQNKLQILEINDHTIGGKTT